MNVLLLSILLAPSLVGPLPNKTALPADSIMVTVSEAESDEGQVVVLLFASEDGFPRDAKKAAYTASAPIQNGSADVRLRGVPAGPYAVVAFHDADADGEMDTNWVGMPKEGVAASNWDGGRPRFESSLIDLGADAATDVRLRLTYR